MNIKIQQKIFWKCDNFVSVLSYAGRKKMRVDGERPLGVNVYILHHKSMPLSESYLAFIHTFTLPKPSDIEHHTICAATVCISAEGYVHQYRHILTIHTYGK